MYGTIMTMEPTLTLPTESTVLPSGRAMPLLGFGTWQLTGPQAVTATAAALDAGYRHLDTATVYDNEEQVGQALARSGVPRSEVFITTKVPPSRAGEEGATLGVSLERLGTDHVDLWLIHWTPEEDEPGAGIGIDLWGALINEREQGYATDIGVSNYSLEQIDQLVAATGVTPAVNQIEWSPLLFDAAVLAGHRERGIVLEGYSGLRGGTLEHPVIVAVAERLGRTPAQVIIRWHLQHGTVVIPKSSRAQRVRSNADVGGFELSAADLVALDALGGS